MIFLLNVKLTMYGLNRYSRGEWLPHYDRVDIFKYALASYAVMNPTVDRYEFYIELSAEFLHRKVELESYIRELFPSEKLNLNWYRHYYSYQWREWCHNTLVDDDQIIWFSGNDDHIFIDNSLSMLRSGIEHLTNDPDPLAQLYYSHWPEQIRLAHKHGATLTSDGNYVVRQWKTFDAIVMMKAHRWKRYWFDADLGNLEVWRTDALWHAPYDLTAPVYSPTKEIVRHYDGYSHVGIELANTAPPLFIPPGFFDKSMKIKFGYFHRDPATTNINPLVEHYYNVDPQGTDYKMILDDLPLFWKDRTLTVDTNPLSKNLAIYTRNTAFIAPTTVSMNTYTIPFDNTNTPPMEWFKNHIV